ncbi:hypothetical protein BU17DRAFT_96155 [Hysterangium stoloniferum]|nr:hypothetical protein BU17DRAFT_96155 [Hysterangium stoloniferum]
MLLQHSLRHYQSRRSSGDVSNEYSQQQCHYFCDILERKWACDDPTHSLCLRTVDKEHHPLSDEHITEWVAGLCSGLATTTDSPPNDLLAKIICDLPAGKVKRETTSPVIVPPALLHDVRLPSMAKSKDIRDKMEFAIQISASRSRVLLARHYAAKTFHIGLLGLNTVDRVVMSMKTRRAIKWLDQSEKRFSGSAVLTITELDKGVQERFSEILKDALEFVRPCYSRNVNLFAADVGSKLVAWLNWTTTGTKAAGRPNVISPEVAMWLAHLHSNISVLYLARSLPASAVSDITWLLLSAIGNKPIHEQDPHVISATFCITAKELAFAPFSRHHRLLGQNIPRMAQLILMYRCLTPEELSGVRMMGYRRIKEGGSEGPLKCRPWEIPLFEMCQVEESGFVDIVKGPLGVSGLVGSFKDLTNQVKKVEMEVKGKRKPPHAELLAICDILQCICAMVFTSMELLRAEGRLVESLVGVVDNHAFNKYRMGPIRAIHILNAIISPQDHISKRLLGELKKANGKNILTSYCQKANPVGTRNLRRDMEVAKEEARNLVLSLGRWG